MECGHLGDGAFGTVAKMLFPKTGTRMAVKVSVHVKQECIHIYVCVCLCMYMYAFTLVHVRIFLLYRYIHVLFKNCPRKSLCVN